MRARGWVSLVVLAFSWLALDDITTDNATRFPLEYTMLVLAGAWFAVLGVWLVVKGRAFAGIGSLMAVVLGVLAFWSLPHHYQPPSAVNIMGYAPLAWFLVLAVWLVAARDCSTGGVRALPDQRAIFCQMIGRPPPPFRKSISRRPVLSRKASATRMPSNILMMSRFCSGPWRSSVDSRARSRK